MYDLSNIHVKSTPEIHGVANIHSDGVSGHTVSQAFLRKMKQHTSYLNQAKTVYAALPVHKPTLSECQDALNLLQELVQEGYDKADDNFEHCQLKRDRFLVGSPYDSGEFEIV